MCIGRLVPDLPVSFTGKAMETGPQRGTVGDLKAHLKEWTQELWSERQPYGPTPPRPSLVSMPMQGRRRIQSHSRFMWDADGQPICHRCGQVGHIGRQCRGRSESQPHLNEQPLLLRSKPQGSGASRV